MQKNKKMAPAGLEPMIFCPRGIPIDHYTTEIHYVSRPMSSSLTYIIILAPQDE